MSLVTDIQDQIAALQAKLALLQSIAEDTFNLGTIAQFSPASGQKVFYLKTAEETWAKISVTGPSSGGKPLREWIVDFKESPIGYFEVYMMTAAAVPFYASA